VGPGQAVDDLTEVTVRRADTLQDGGPGGEHVAQAVEHRLPATVVSPRPTSGGGGRFEPGAAVVRSAGPATMRRREHQTVDTRLFFSAPLDRLSQIDACGRWS
jgi:hypothetical protein